MKRLFWMVTLMTAFVFTMDAQNNYARLWSKVQKAEKEGKPQTAAGYLKELEEKLNSNWHMNLSKKELDLAEH